MLTTINFDNGSKVLSHIPVTPDLEIKLKDLMTKAQAFSKAYSQVRDSIPKDYYANFYGNWDLLVIKELDDESDL